MSTLDHDRWLAVSPYLDRALEMSSAELAAWLVSFRSEQPALAADLEQLLGDLEESRRIRFLEDPVGRDLSLPTVASDPPEGEGVESSLTPRVADHGILRRIGRGSYGGVWLARNATGQLRAVKVVWRRNFSSERPYEREFKGVQRFEPISRSHPGLMEVLHVGRDAAAGYFYYVMELADSIRGEAKDLTLPISPADYEPRTLASDLKSRGRLPPTEVLTLGAQLANALGYLHRRRLIHRDVKPSNVIYVGGQTKL